jgi:hypothetical protein
LVERVLLEPAGFADFALADLFAVGGLLGPPARALA